MASKPVGIQNLRFKVNATAAPTLTERINMLRELPLLYGLSVYQFAKVLTTTLLTSPLQILNINALRDEAFSLTWLSCSGPTDPTSPLAPFLTLLGDATGSILEIGPGDGRQIQHFTNPGVKAIYGAEPCEPLHGPLRAEAEKVGLGAKYVVLNTGVQEAGLLKELEKAGVVGEGQGRREVFDTIVCSKVLCSVPDQEAAVKTLYSLLKPGGTLLACEHVSNRWREPKGSLVARIQQVVFTYLGWTFFMGGCHLNRDTEAVLKKAAEADGGWKELDFERVTEWGSIPFVFGRFVKR